MVSLHEERASNEPDCCLHAAGTAPTSVWQAFNKRQQRSARTFAESKPDDKLMIATRESQPQVALLAQITALSSEDFERRQLVNFYD